MDESFVSPEKVESKLRQFILKSTFWTDFIDITNKHFNLTGTEYNCINDLTRLFEGFNKQVKQWIEVEDEDILERHLLVIKAGLLLLKPKKVDQIFRKLYENSFEAYKNLHRDIFNVSDELTEFEDDEEEIYCNTCDQEKDNCQCHVILENFTGLNNVLSRLRLIDNLCNPAIVNLIYTQLTGFIEKHIKGEFGERWIEKVFNWMNKGLVAWLEFITSTFEIQALKESSCLTVEEWRERLSYFVYKAFAEMRISELFEIIVEYPDSLPAIQDLKECLAKTETTRKLLAESLRTSFEKRLLHPAVNTDDILTQYVSAIRTLRELDPSGVILENVCLPLREYLRSREDTIKCIITCLTDQGTGPDLADELFGTDDKNMNQDNDVESDGEDWKPDPIDAVKTDLTSKNNRTADIINILVNIYGSQDMFVSQYRVLLADRILTNFSYDISNERRYIELLKRRFGENHLLYCDVMLKDIQDSQRINRIIKDEMGKKDSENKTEDQLEFDAFILSSVFWPTLSEETVEPPDDVQKIMDGYTESYKQSKGMRTLEWLNNLGSVEIEVELDDGGIKTFNATPAQATLLIKFQEKEEWNLNELSTQININKTSLRSRISYWIGQGVIVEKQNDIFATAQSFQTQLHDASMCESDEDTGIAFAQNQKDEELQIYWSYVVGMLTNIGSLPLDRIHSMLKMFASHDTSMQCTQDDVKAFLQKKVADGELLYVGGMYKLPKSP